MNRLIYGDYECGGVVGAAACQKTPHMLDLGAIETIMNRLIYGDYECGGVARGSGCQKTPHMLHWGSYMLHWGSCWDDYEPSHLWGL